MKKVIATLTLASALALPGVIAAHAMTADGGFATAPASILVYDQKLDGKSVAAKYVHLPRDGYVVVYTSDGAKLSSDIVGTLALKKGDHRDVKIELQKTPEKGSALWATLYEDADGDGKFDKAKDKSFWSGELPPTDSRFNVL